MTDDRLRGRVVWRTVTPVMGLHLGVNDARLQLINERVARSLRAEHIMVLDAYRIVREQVPAEWAFHDRFHMSQISNWLILRVFLNGLCMPLANEVGDWIWARLQPKFKAKRTQLRWATLASKVLHGLSRAQPYSEADIEAAFRAVAAADRLRTGISFDALKRALLANGVYSNDDETRDCMELADKDHNNDIDEAEFMAVLLHAGVYARTHGVLTRTNFGSKPKNRTASAQKPKEAASSSGNRARLG